MKECKDNRLDDFSLWIGDSATLKQQESTMTVHERIALRCKAAQKEIDDYDKIPYKGKRPVISGNVVEYVLVTPSSEITHEGSI